MKCKKLVTATFSYAPGFDEEVARLASQVTELRMKGVERRKRTEEEEDGGGRGRRRKNDEEGALEV